MHYEKSKVLHMKQKTESNKGPTGCTVPCLLYIILGYKKGGDIRKEFISSYSPNDRYVNFSIKTHTDIGLDNGQA
jgi:hypothetical protein